MYFKFIKNIIFYLIIFTSFAFSKITIAIFDLQVGSGVNRQEAVKISALLRSEFNKRAEVSVIDRKNISNIMKEQALSESGLVNDKNIIETGKLLSANLLVSGMVSKTHGKIIIVLNVTDSRTSKTIFSDSIYCLEIDLALSLNEFTRHFLKEYQLQNSDITMEIIDDYISVEKWEEAKIVIDIYINRMSEKNADVSAELSKKRKLIYQKLALLKLKEVKNEWSKGNLDEALKTILYCLELDPSNKKIIKLKDKIRLEKRKDELEFANKRIKREKEFKNKMNKLSENSHSRRDRILNAKELRKKYRERVDLITVKGWHVGGGAIIVNNKLTTLNLENNVAWTLEAYGIGAMDSHGTKPFNLSPFFGISGGWNGLNGDVHLNFATSPFSAFSIKIKRFILSFGAGGSAEIGTLEAVGFYYQVGITGFLNIGFKLSRRFGFYTGLHYDSFLYSNYSPKKNSLRIVGGLVF